jgi:non-ribosomal peptide synthase protein (TIGR01720 family)
VLLGDLETLCRQLSSGRPPRLPEGGTTIATWARRLEHHAASPRVLDEAPAWETLLRGRRPLARAGDGKGPLLQVHRLGAPDTARWLERAARTGLRPDAFLLAALAEAMAPWTEGPELLVELEGHGRRTFAPALDVSRTVGWFTVTHPFAVAPGNGTLEERAERIHRALGSVPAGGLGYGLLRYNSPSTPAVRRLRALDGPEVAFNYLGRLDLALEPGGLFRTAPEPAGPEQGHPGPLTHTLDLNCRVEGGRLIVEWTADRSRLGATPLHRVAERFFTTLRR